MSTAPVAALDRLLLLTQHLYSTFVAPFLPPQLASLIASGTSLFASLVLPILRSGDLTSIAALLVILYISLRTLDYIRRSVIGWVMLLVKMVVLLLIVQGVWYVNAYGWEKAVQDAGWVGGMVWGWAEGAWEGSAGGASGGSGFGRAGTTRGGKGQGSRWGNASGGRQQAWA